MCQYYHEHFVEPGQKQLYDYSPLEIAQFIYTRDEIEDQYEAGTLFSPDINLLQDFRTVQGLSISLKGLQSLPIVKKYHGECPVSTPQGKHPFSIIKNRSVQRRLGLNDQSMIVKLYQLFDGTDDQSDGPSQD